MRLIFLGPPGVGKGTQASSLSKKYAVPHIATGDILRKEMAENSSLGLKAKSFIDAGKLVPDEIIIQMMNERIKQSDAQSGYILDGFPRTLAQGDALTKALSKNGEKIDCVIYFHLDDSALVERISGRRSCPSCQSVYHVVYNKPKNDGICACGTPLIQRKDDNLDTVKNRLSVYKNETFPLITYFKDQGLLAEVVAEGSVGEVTEKVEGVIRGCSI